MPIKTPEDRKKHLAKLGPKFVDSVKLLNKALKAFSKDLPLEMKHKSMRADKVITECIDTLRGLMVSVITHFMYLDEPVKKPRAKKKKPTAAKVLRPAKTGKVTAAQARKAVKNVLKKKKRKK